jgi:hypothetical protein
MKRRRCVGAALCAILGLTCCQASAEPSDCLALRDNAQVAACANQYGLGAAATSWRAGHEPKPAIARAAKTVAGDEPIAIPVVRAAQPAPAPAVEAPARFTLDRSALTETMLAGAAGSALLVLTGLGLWRLGSNLRRACRWCGAKIARSAHTCPHCFRAV